MLKEHAGSWPVAIKVHSKHNIFFRVNPQDIVGKIIARPEVTVGQIVSLRLNPI